MSAASFVQQSIHYAKGAALMTQTVPTSAGLPAGEGAVTVITRRNIGGLNLDVTVSETHTDEMEITEHPVEQGAPVNDHAYMRPSELRISAGHGKEGKQSAQDMYDKLLDLQKKREPFDVYTGKRVYKNMLIQSLSVTTDKSTENVLMFDADLREVVIVKTETTRVPASRQKGGGAKTGSPQQTGTKQAEPETQPKRKSAIKILTGG